MHEFWLWYNLIIDNWIRPTLTFTIEYPFLLLTLTNHCCDWEIPYNCSEMLKRCLWIWLHFSQVLNILTLVLQLVSSAGHWCIKWWDREGRCLNFSCEARTSYESSTKIEQKFRQYRTKVLPKSYQNFTKTVTNFHRNLA